MSSQVRQTTSHIVGLTLNITRRRNSLVDNTVNSFTLNLYTRFWALDTWIKFTWSLKILVTTNKLKQLEKRVGMSLANSCQQRNREHGSASWIELKWDLRQSSKTKIVERIHVCHLHTIEINRRVFSSNGVDFVDPLQMSYKCMARHSNNRQSSFLAWRSFLNWSWKKKKVYHRVD